MVELVNPPAALARTCASLGLKLDCDRSALVTQAARRAAYAEAPCTRYHLERTLFDSLSALGIDADWGELVDSAIDDLIQYGDLLEMRIDDEQSGRRGFHIWPAPPGYVLRPDNALVLLGVAGDEITPQLDWPAPIQYRRGIRFVLANDANEKVAAESGLQRLPESAWLRAPAAEQADAYLASWIARLRAEPVCHEIEELELLGGAGPKRGVKRRWTTPTTADKGVFVGRRGQRYGNPRWCVVDLVSGAPTRLLDLAADGDVERPCDVAWRIKAAIDTAAGRPQAYDAEEVDGRATLHFFGPLPSWAERRLAIIGDKSESARGLFAFSVPADAVEREMDFLSARLWLERRTTRMGQ
jgi:hypothetical protein